MQKKYTMHVISGTHWDREWRHTAEQSKLRLSDLMDSIIKVLETNKEYKCFCLDGGMVVVEDYLTVRPENKDRIIQLVKEKKLQLVNWYTLPEMFTVAPESLIRNLLLGFKKSEEFGSGIDMGYTATSYGQVSQLPQIYQGFGIKTAMFYRGTNKHVLPPVFKWEGPDGTNIIVHKTFDDVTRTNWFFYVHQPLVLGKTPRDVSYKYDSRNIPVHLCDEGLYERAFTLQHETNGFNHDEKTLKEALSQIKNHTMEYAFGNHLLALNLEDNDKAFNLLPDMIRELNLVSEDINIIQDSFDEYIKIILKDIKQKGQFVHKGELRYTAVEQGGWGGLLGATHSSRIKLKLLNEEVETNLIFLAEPFASLAFTMGWEYPQNYINRAWEALLKNHAHDSICGAAIERAHDDMLYGFSISNTISEEVAARSLTYLYSKINTVRDFEKGDHTITIFNSMNFPRKEVIPVVIDLPGESLYFDIIDNRGNKIEYVLLSSDNIKMNVERELDTSTSFPAIRKRMLINVEVPQLGYMTYALRSREPNYITHLQTGPDRQFIARANGVLENEHLLVTIKPNGTFNLYNKETGSIMDNLHYFTDAGETGNNLVSIQPSRNQIYTSIGCQASIVLVETNPLRGIFRIDLLMNIPAAATESDRIHESVEIPISYWLTLEKGGKFLKIKTRIHNKARDHKLCVNIPTRINTDYVDVESAFTVETRPIRWTISGDNAEPFYPYQPMQNFIDLNGGYDGLAVLNKGLREYEVKDDKERTIALTLIRTHRKYMTSTENMTPEELEKQIGSHCFGVLEYKYAIYPHTGNWLNGQVLQKAYQHKVGLKAIQGVPVNGELPCKGNFINVSPESKVLISALKLSENGKGIILRLWNITAAKQVINIDTIFPLKGVKHLNLNEKPINNIELESGKFQFEFEPHKIETFLLE